MGFEKTAGNDLNRRADANVFAFCEHLGRVRLCLGYCNVYGISLSSTPCLGVVAWGFQRTIHTAPSPTQRAASRPAGSAASTPLRWAWGRQAGRQAGDAWPTEAPQGGGLRGLTATDWETAVCHRSEWAEVGDRLCSGAGNA